MDVVTKYVLQFPHVSFTLLTGGSGEQQQRPILQYSPSLSSILNVCALETAPVAVTDPQNPTLGAIRKLFGARLADKLVPFEYRDVLGFSFFGTVLLLYNTLHYSVCWRTGHQKKWCAVE